MMPLLLDVILAPIVYAFVLPHQIRKYLAENTTLEYLQNLANSESLRSVLGSALNHELPGLDRYPEQIFEKFAVGDDVSEWNQECFERFVHAQYGDDVETLNRAIPLLWRCVVAAAYFPLLSNDTTDVIDKQGFLQAYALLVLQGINLMGTKRRGFEAEDGERPADRDRRIARFIHTCISQKDFDSKDHEKGSGTETEDDESAMHNEHATQNAYEAIYFAQPITYESWQDLSVVIRNPRVRKEYFRDVADRLAGQSSSAPQRVRFEEMQTIMEVLLLVFVREEVWKEGVNSYSRQRSADVHFSQFDLSPGEWQGTRELATFMISFLFDMQFDQIRPEDEIPFAAFEQVCDNCPTFIFLFFQIWACIFAPISRSTIKTSLATIPTSIINCCCLLQPAKFKAPHPQARFFDHELRMLLDLQASTMVFDANDSNVANSTQAALKKVLMTGDHFHVMMVECEATDWLPLLQVLFVGPEDPRMELWRPDPEVCQMPERGWAEYAWKTSVVQLFPEMARINLGRLAVDRGEEGRSLVLKSLDGDDRGTTRVSIDIAEKSCSISSVGDGRKQEWTSLRCHRMPGTARRITGTGRPRPLFYL